MECLDTSTADDSCLATITEDGSFDVYITKDKTICIYPEKIQIIDERMRRWRLVELTLFEMRLFLEYKREIQYILDDLKLHIEHDNVAQYYSHLIDLWESPEKEELRSRLQQDLISKRKEGSF